MGYHSLKPGIGISPGMLMFDLSRLTEKVKVVEPFFHEGDYRASGDIIRRTIDQVRSKQAAVAATHSQRVVTLICKVENDGRGVYCLARPTRSLPVSVYSFFVGANVHVLLILPGTSCKHARAYLRAHLIVSYPQNCIPQDTADTGVN